MWRRSISMTSRINVPSCVTWHSWMERQKQGEWGDTTHCIPHLYSSLRQNCCCLLCRLAWRLGAVELAELSSLPVPLGYFTSLCNVTSVIPVCGGEKSLQKRKFLLITSISFRINGLLVISWQQKQTNKQTATTKTHPKPKPKPTRNYELLLAFWKQYLK